MDPHQPPPAYDDVSHRASTVASRAKTLRATASSFFGPSPTPPPVPTEGPSRRISPRLNSEQPPVPESIPCPLCPTFKGSDVWGHVRKSHANTPFHRVDFAGFEDRVQICEDCGAVLKPGKAARTHHLKACPGKTKGMEGRLGGKTWIVDARKRREYSFPTAVGSPSSTPATSTPRPPLAATPAASAPHSLAHPTPPSLVLSRDVPRSSPEGDTYPIPPAFGSPPASPSLPAASPDGRAPPRPMPPTTAPSRPPPAPPSPVIAPPRTSQLLDEVAPWPNPSGKGMADLLPLPGSIKHLHPALVNAFIATAGRMAKRFLEDPNDEKMFDVLSLVKVGLVPALRNGHTAVKDRLAAFPTVPWPAPEEKGRETSRSETRRARELVEAGLVGKAERALNDNAKIAPLTDATTEALKRKHPAGEDRPFRMGLAPTTAIPTVPVEDDIEIALRSFKPDTAPGPSGWTVKLMTLAARDPDFKQFLTTITSGIAMGVLCGREMLCTARLTPLMKPDGGIRPIAVGEMFYRLAMKAIFTTNVSPDFLAPNQFGIGTKGGAEVVVNAVQMARSGHKAFPYTTLTSLDAINAFNELSRSAKATAIRKHAPVLFRCAAWSYNSPSPLLVHSDGKTVVIESAQGSRQGDPMGPLFFSVAIRDTVEALQRLLGDRYLVLAYLDDIFILGPDEGALDAAIDFFGREGSPLRLNRAKCKEVRLETLRDGGFEMLGTCVGSERARRAFLERKIEKVEESLTRIHTLPKQHALLILRQSLQHKLRHLLRSLDSSDLLDLWRRLDNAIWSAFDKIRGLSPSLADAPRDRSILSLPPNLGGLGLSAHEDHAPLAYKAASALAIDALLPLVPALDEPANPLTQRELCREAAINKQKSLMATLDLSQQITVVESGSQLGRKWLVAIPSAPRFSLDNPAVQSALYYRTLLPGYTGKCKKCATANSLGHDECCLGRRRHAKTRHDAVKSRMAAALQSIPGATVTVEPYMLNRLDRLNDIKVVLDDEEGRGVIAEEYDLKVVSLYAPTHLASMSTRGRTREEIDAAERAVAEGRLAEEAERRAVKLLKQEARSKITSLPAEERARVEGTRLFTPLVISTGGLQDPETAEKIREWKKWKMPMGVHGMLMMAISVALIRARARTLLMK